MPGFHKKSVSVYSLVQDYISVPEAGTASYIEKRKALLSAIEIQARFRPTTVNEIVTTISGDSTTALYLAANNNELELVALLLKYGAKNSVKNQNGVEINVTRSLRNQMEASLLATYPGSLYGLLSVKPDEDAFKTHRDYSVIKLIEDYKPTAKSITPELK